MHSDEILKLITNPGFGAIGGIEIQMGMKYRVLWIGCIQSFILIYSIFAPKLTIGQRITYTDSDRNAILEAHNKERRLVGNSDLAWDYQLEEYAANWANIIASRGTLAHRPNNQFGENCYMTTASYVSPEEPILAFNSEKEDYHYGPVSSQNWYGTGHYTQVIWYRTTRVGCAAVKSSSGIFVVCNYNPPGNLMGDFPYRQTSRPSYNPSTTEISSNPSMAIAPTVANTQNTDARSSIAPSTASSNPQPKTISTAQSNSRPNKRNRYVPSIWMISGIETWNTYQNTPIQTHLKSGQKSTFTGATPVFQFMGSLPKKEHESIRNVRGILDVGFHLPNKLLASEWRILQVTNSTLRLSSPIHVGIGLNLWNSLELSTGKMTFGQLQTENQWDFHSLQLASCRLYIPIGNQFKFSLNFNAMSSQKSKFSDWSLFSLGLSIRSTFI